jgi:FemAB-related protein (PEP-CTERM system-associated)
VKVELLKPPDTADWEKYVALHPRGSLFHSERWARLLGEVYGCTAHYLLARRSAAICGILPLLRCGSGLTGSALVALPYAGTQPAVLADDDECALALVDAAIAHAHAIGVDCVELREEGRHTWPLPVTRGYLNIRLPLEADPDRVWRRVESRVRTKVRAARSRGLTAHWHGEEALDDFFAAYADTMHRLGSPPHSKRLFSRLFAIYPDAARVLAIRDGALVVAAAIVIQDGRWIGFPWAASLSKAISKHPNNLLYWTLIEYACTAGYANLDLGRSPRDSGTAHFKLQWGAEPRELNYYFGLARARAVPHRDAKDRHMILASLLWRHLPLALANLAGPWLARLIP